jgi:hypothetical protein
MRRIALLFVCSAASIGAQRPAVSAPISQVEGDVYVVTQAGETRKGAGRTVYLLTDADGTLRPRVAAACEQATRTVDVMIREQQAVYDSIGRLSGSKSSDGEIVRLTGRNAALYHGVVDSVRAVRARLAQPLFAASVDTTGSGMNAHYTFPSVKPGKYAVFAVWPLGETIYAWFAPVSVQSGGKFRRDLDNSALDDLVSCTQLDKLLKARR